MDANQPIAGKRPFYNLHVNVLARDEFMADFRNAVETDATVSVNFLNAHCFNTAQVNADYKSALDRSTYLLNDGVGIDIAGKLIGLRFPDNMNGTDLIPELLTWFANNDMSVFLYGARPEVIRRTADTIRSQYPTLEIKGYSDGYVTPRSAVADRIRECEADVVILGLGVPLQELWVDEFAAVSGKAKVFICGGAIFDFISGNARRAPKWIRYLKLEWLFRLLREPTRLFSRYITGSFRFAWYVATRRGNS